MLKLLNLLLLLITCLRAAGSSALTPADSVVTITIRAVPGLQFDQVRFQVKPNTRITLVLTNTDDMSHNLLITRPDAREKVVSAAMNLGAAGPEKHFIPDLPEVLWAIPVLSPGQTQSIRFTTPQEPGVYPYVCTYPGHGFVMYGAMYVGDEPLPAIQQDLNIPGSRRTAPAATAGETHTGHPESWHPYRPVAPYLYRIFMPDASPAAIAVHLPQHISYCWDAGTCRLRYAWQGGFLANLDHWQDKGDTYGKPGGTIFYRDKTDFPLRIGAPENIPVVEYKGYRLINRYPEFQYTVNGTEVYELISPADDGSGLVRNFRIPAARQKIRFLVHPGDGVQYTASAGKWKNGQLILSPRQARQFSIRMIKKEEAQL